MQHIYIVRHGQSVANAERKVAGQTESPLTPLGEEQALHAGEAASELEVDLIVSSPMQRARHTAEIIAKTIGYPIEDIQNIPELKERRLGELEGKPYAPGRTGSGNALSVEKTQDVETADEFFERIKRALEIIHELPGKVVLVICHNGTGRMLMNIAEGGQPLDMYSYPRLDNARIYPLDYS